MTLFDKPRDIEQRENWRMLFQTTLPEAAKSRTDWPVDQDHCFARILLDNATGQPWRNIINPPAWRHAPLPIIQLAIDMGEDVLNGKADIWALNNHSLIMRGKSPKQKPA